MGFEYDVRSLLAERLFAYDFALCIASVRPSLHPSISPFPSLLQHFSVLVAEGRPEGAGFEAADVLAKAGVPVTVVLDSAVGYHMEVADLCVTGAEGVLENGGIVNKVTRMLLLARRLTVNGMKLSNKRRG